MRSVPGLAVALLIGMPGVSFAQSPRPPVVELGAQVGTSAGDQPAASTSPPTEWQRVKPGREVWVTTGAGSMVHGKVAAISDSSLTIRQQSGDVTIRLGDVRLVEGRDGVKNGFFIGAGSGAVAGGVLIGWVVSVVCASEPCDGGEGVAVLLAAAGGAAVGGLIGALVDGIIPGKQSLFDSTGIRVIPVLSSKTKAVDIKIHWR